MADIKNILFVLLILFAINSKKSFSQLNEIPQDLRGKWIGSISVNDTLHTRKGSAMVSLSNFGYKVDGKIEFDWNFKNDKIRIPGFPIPLISNDSAGFITLQFDGSLPLRNSLTFGTFFFTHAYYNNIPFLTGTFKSKNMSFRAYNVLIRLLQKDYNKELIKEGKDLEFPIKVEVLSQFDKKNRIALFGHDINKNLSKSKIIESGVNKFIIDKNHKAYSYALPTVTPNNQLALLGNHQIGINVIILNNKTGESFYCKTTTFKKFVNEIEGETLVTTLDKNIYVRYPEEQLFTAVLINNIAPFKLVARTLIEDKSLIDNIDLKIKDTGQLEQILTINDQAKFAKGYLDILNLKKPEVYQLDIPGLNAKVITYKLNENEIGPRFVELNSKIIPLSGQCCYLDFQVYKYGNNYFIKSNAGACESGYIVSEIFELRDNIVIKEFSDSGYSN